MQHCELRLQWQTKLSGRLQCQQTTNTPSTTKTWTLMTTLTTATTTVKTAPPSTAMIITHDNVTTPITPTTMTLITTTTFKVTSMVTTVPHWWKQRENDVNNGYIKNINDDCAFTTPATKTSTIIISTRTAITDDVNYEYSIIININHDDYSKCSSITLILQQVKRLSQQQRSQRQQQRRSWLLNRQRCQNVTKSNNISRRYLRRLYLQCAW